LPIRTISVCAVSGTTGEPVKNLALDRVANRVGSFFNDIAVDEILRVAYIFDGGLRSAPQAQVGLIVVDHAVGTARRIACSMAAPACGSQ
jgi:hypothetical protein